MTSASTTPNGPLRLALGSHQAGTGRGCAMNVVSWENGDTRITDLPACSDPMLARIVQRVNDTICTHRDGDLLCPSCSLIVLDLAHRTVGTSSHGLSPLDLQRVWVRVVADQARQVQHLNTDPRVEAAIVAAERWADEPSNAAAAYAAYDAAYAAAYAANAANDAYAAARRRARLDLAHRAVDTFLEHTGLAPTTVDHTVTAQAIVRMLTVAT